MLIAMVESSTALCPVPFTQYIRLGENFKNKNITGDGAQQLGLQRKPGDMVEIVRMTNVHCQLHPNLDSDQAKFDQPEDKYIWRY